MCLMSNIYHICRLTFINTHDVLLLLGKLRCYDILFGSVLQPSSHILYLVLYQENQCSITYDMTDLFRLHVNVLDFFFRFQ